MARSRRNKSSLYDDLFEFLVDVPTWAGPIVMLITYAGSRWLIPAIFRIVGGGGDSFGQSMAEPLSQFFVKLAPLFAVIVFLVWIVAELHKLKDRRRFDKQSGIDSIKDLDWREFESLLSEAFRRQGFVVEHTGKAGPDGGIDVRLSKAGAVSLVQCKHWKQQQVGVKIVRELLGVVTSEKAQSGIVVTSGQFTTAAIEFAAKNPVRLIDGNELVQMISEVQNSDRVKSKPAQVIVSERPKPTAPVAAQPAPTCPKCGSVMVRRIAKRGQNAGSEFFGCSRYPECKGIRDLNR